MDDAHAAELLMRSAPSDVNDTIAWLVDRGYALSARRGDGTFGAYWIYSGDAEVIVTVDRSQWMLEVAAAQGSAPWQYDVLLAALAAKPYAEVFPRVGGRALDDPLPTQLPEGVSWRETLPAVLSWLREGDAAAIDTAVSAARDERSELRWRG